MIEELAPGIVALELSNKYGKFAIEPLERGFGHTLGNAFRRVLLAHVPGAAVTDVRIDGVPHAFTTIKGVYEDATELCLNIKELAIKVHAESVEEGEELIAHIVAAGKGEVLGGDIKCPPGVEIINPDVHLATLTEDDSELLIDLWIERSTGYRPVEEPGREKRPGEVIALDALFSPIARCTYRVEPTRLGARTDLDRLMLEVWGDGTVMPDDAMRQAAEILVRYITVFSDIELPEVEEEEVPQEAEVLNQILAYPIEEMEFSVRTFNCLKKENIDTVGELVARTEEGLLNIRNFGKRSLEEVIEKLAAVDLGLREAEAAEELVEEEDG